jgi:hypothetical protein
VAAANVPPHVVRFIEAAAALDQTGWTRAFDAWSAAGTAYGEAMRALSAPAALASAVRKAVSGSLRTALPAIDAADPRNGITTATTLMNSAGIALADPSSVPADALAALVAPFAAAGLPAATLSGDTE